MVSGHYVAPSWTQNLAGLANTFVGQRGLEKADKAQIDLAKAIRTQHTDELNQFNQLLPKNPMEAYSFAAQAYNPKLQEIGIKNMLPQQFDLSEGQKRYMTMPDGSVKEIAKGGAKSPSNIQAAAIVLGLDQKPIEQWTAQDRANIDAKIQETQRSGAANLGQKDFSNSLSLRKEFNNEPVYKGHQEIKSAWNTINVGLKQANPAGDLAAATKFMKLLDPTSVVRESELLLAMKATGALDKLYNYAQMRANGTLLTPKQRGEFGELANQFYQTATNQYNSKYGEYADIAKRNNLNPLDIGRPEAGIHNSQWGEVQVVK
jgi:hypothetical protein